MNAVVGLGLALAACGPGLAPVDQRIEAQNALVAAANDPAKLEELFHGFVTNGGLWFADSQCEAQFGAGAEVSPDRQPAFARCLAGLHLQPSTRGDALGDVTVMTYAPGIEVEARVAEEEIGPRLSWIGFESRRALDAPLPTITPAQLETVRLTGDLDGPLDPSEAKVLELDPTPTSHAEYAWLRVCVDENGAVSLAHTFETTSPAAKKLFEAAAQKWTFKPYVLGGAPTHVCAMERMSYPPGRGPVGETLPMPPPPSRDKQEPIVFAKDSKTSRLVEGARIAGTKFIAPDDHTKTQIARRHLRQIQGSFRVCLDEAGAVESVLPFRSSGFAAYDRKIIATIASTWRYAPYKVDDVAKPVCTAITFIYSQR
jgi:hypothetical protein